MNRICIALISATFASFPVFAFSGETADGGAAAGGPVANDEQSTAPDQAETARRLILEQCQTMDELAKQACIAKADDEYARALAEQERQQSRENDEALASSGDRSADAGQGATTPSESDVRQASKT